MRLVRGLISRWALCDLCENVLPPRLRRPDTLLTRSTCEYSFMSSDMALVVSSADAVVPPVVGTKSWPVLAAEPFFLRREVDRARFFE